MIYTLPKQITSETKITKNLFLFDMLFIGFIMILAWFFNGLVYDEIKIIYYISCFVIALVLRTKSKLNPKKRIFNSIYLFLIKDRKVYSRF